jgi:hypothetical protein
MLVLVILKKSIHHHIYEEKFGFFSESDLTLRETGIEPDTYGKGWKALGKGFAMSFSRQRVHYKQLFARESKRELTAKVCREYCLALGKEFLRRTKGQKSQRSDPPLAAVARCHHRPTAANLAAEEEEATSVMPDGHPPPSPPHRTSSPWWRMSTWGGGCHHGGGGRLVENDAAMGRRPHRRHHHHHRHRIAGKVEDTLNERKNEGPTDAPCAARSKGENGGGTTGGARSEKREGRAATAPRATREEPADVALGDVCRCGK